MTKHTAVGQVTRDPQSIDAFNQLVQAESDEHLDALRRFFQDKGFSAFRGFLDEFHTYIKKLQDGQSDEAYALIDKARRMMPQPEKLSPSWAGIWDQLARMIEFKLKALREIPADVRDGEWQVLVDNPYMNREVACYPALDFEEASYLYAKFRPTLEHHEYIRIQKIQTHLTEFGNRDEKVPGPIRLDD